MSGHTHDHIDWADRLVLLRAADTLDAPAHAAIAARLAAKLPATPTVIDLGCGAGGMSIHFAEALATQTGGTIILVDATPELLHEAERAVRAAADAAQANRADGSTHTSNGRVPDGSAEPSGGHRAAAEHTASTAADSTRAVEGIAQTVEGAAQTAADTASTAEGAAPTVADTAPASEGAAPTVADTASTIEGAAQTVADTAPAAEGAAQTVTDTASAIEGTAQAAADTAPTVEGAARAAGGITPTAEETAQTVEIRAVVADLADGSLPDLLPPADLVWASRVVHHLPDQQAAIGTLTAVARTGGVVALAEGGLSFSCLPWDLGLGRPGLEDRLKAAQAEWFVGMREGIDGAVPMPYGWPLALERAGLADVSSFSALADHPAPGPDGLADYVHHHLSRLATHGAEHLSDEDRATLASLLDPDSTHYLGNRRDLFLLGARTVHHGRRP
ncbi:methyltransferase domain-containing protein [Amycolatopsis rubida]|uniref:Methyltransferase domain-containing protein n=1 Tax=Amycolatopsis rubida TaxID=112413 RepID=A0ABX0BKS2_9PSEU|nr:methyltransferase domain-containing protein [Amycolatopsis sp. M39]MYW91181.1 methyltransferase domain-containing protein [Amycolatopsis rubida]NEC56166.1 methyltransferase domain-containing protein [Amycolatopsis rubida]